MPKLIVKTLKKVHLVDPLTLQAITMDQFGKEVKVEDNQFWRGKDREELVKIINEVPNVPVEKDLKVMNKNELLAFAKEKGIDVGNVKKKEEILLTIELELEERGKAAEPTDDK